MLCSIISDVLVGLENNTMSISQRKKDHIEICKDQSVETSRSCFSDYHYAHNALPEIAFRDISTELSFFGYDISMPLMISSMTGGSTDAVTINKNLAIAASKMNIPLALGSQRIMIEDKKSWPTFDIKEYTENIPVFGNFGAVNIVRDIPIVSAKEALDFIGADGVFLHLNSMQEVVQEGGDVDFSGVLKNIVKFQNEIDIPVIVKEVGFGINGEVARRLKEAGIEYVDVAGKGGTSWTYVESQRSQNAHMKNLGELFANWGNDTCECLIECSKIDDLTVISSGGVRTGIDIAKSISLGATIASMARPFLLTACISDEVVIDFIKKTNHELKVTMFGVGAQSLEDLSKTELLYERRK